MTGVPICSFLLSALSDLQKLASSDLSTISRPRWTPRKESKLLSKGVFTLLWLIFFYKMTFWWFLTGGAPDYISLTGGISSVYFLSRVTRPDASGMCIFSFLL